MTPVGTTHQYHWHVVFFRKITINQIYVGNILKYSYELDEF